MKTLALPILLLSFVAAVHAAPPVPASKAVTLVRAMRADELAVSGAKRAFITGALQDRYPKAGAGCVKRTDPADFTEKFSRVVEQVLTPAEIDQALVFYQSEAGVKYVEGTLRRLRAKFGEDSGIPKIAGVEDISPAQTAAIADFASSELGRKIAGKQMTESPAAIAFGRDMMEEIAGRCSR